MRRFLLVSTVFAAVAALACSAGRTRDDPFAGSSEEGEDVLTMHVANRNQDNATVYAVSGPRRVRVGITRGNSERTYTVDWPGGPRELQAEIELARGGRYTTTSIAASGGSRVSLIIERQLRNSYLQRGG